MSTNRRTFLKWAATLGSALGLAPLGSRLDAASLSPTPKLKRRDVGRPPASLNILILGGTGFTGPEQVDYAIARGHRVTLFNRGKTRPGVFKGKVAEELVGDLNGDTSALEGKTFDVVIDNPTTYPAWVRNAAKYLKGNTKHYMFISTTSVYSDQSVVGINEQSPTTPMPADLDPYTLVPAHAGQYYGALKTRAEQEVEMHYPGINTVIRPCLIVG
ncbi:MAG: epimerase, partial [Gemmatimonadaceae bacterium]